MWLFRRTRLMVGGLLVALISSACAGDADRTPDSVISSDLIGHWRLVVSCGGIAGDCIYADSAGENRIMVLSPSGDFYETVNDSVVVEGEFQIERRKWRINDEVSECLSVDAASVNRCVIRVTEDSLILGDDFVDGFTYTYVALGKILPPQ